MGNSSNKSSLRKSQSVPDTQRLSPDAPVFDKQKSVSQLRLNHTQDKPGKPGKAGKKQKQQREELPQLPPAEATFLPEFPFRGDLEELDFKILDVIARGAYGNVIKVQREAEKKFYAVKVLDKIQIIEEGAIRQCKEEATIQSMAGEHPLVVKAYEYWQSRRSLYIVLDYVPYGDMFTLWTFHGAFPEKLVQVYIAEMAMAIDFLHNASVIYRDVKMENILFNAKGHIQLTDFGLAKWLKGGEQTRTVCGTLQYMAPEVLSVYPYGHSADWWSLGILMYAMLAGKYPVDGGDTHTKMAQKVFESDFLLPSDISDAAQDVISRVLTKSPHKRLQEVNSLQDLDFFQDIFFGDLIEEKLNPVDVVPEDFFPMSGLSWAPQLLTDEEQKDFDQFDDSGNTVTGEPGYPQYPHYHVNPQQDHTGHRPLPPRVYNQQPHQVSERQYNSQNEQHPQDQPSDQHQSSQIYQDHYKSFPELRETSFGRETPPLVDGNTHNAAVINDNRLELSTAAASGFNTLHTASSEGWLSNVAISGYNDRNKSVANTGSDARSNNVATSGYDAKSNNVATSGYDAKSNSVATYGYGARRSSADGNNKDRIGEMSESSNFTQKRYINPDRPSFSISSQSHTEAVRRTNVDTGLPLMSSVTPGNNFHGSLNGGTNRISSGPEYKMVEAPPTMMLRTVETLPTVTLRTPETPPTTTLRTPEAPPTMTLRSVEAPPTITFRTVEAPPTVTLRNTQALPTTTLKEPTSTNSIKPGYYQSVPNYTSQTSVGDLIPSGYNLPNTATNKQVTGLNSTQYPGSYQAQTSNPRASLHTAGFNITNNTQPTDQGYKTLESPPTINVPTPSTRFNQNPSVTYNKDLQRPLPPTTNNFPVNFTNSSQISSDYQRSNQAYSTFTNTPQIISRPIPPSRPVPPQKPLGVSKPPVPIKPIPTPRRSLRHKNFKLQGGAAPSQISNFNKQHPYTSNTNQNSNLSAYAQNTNINTSPINHQEDWQILSGSHPQLLQTTTTTTDLNKNRSGSNGNIFASSDNFDSETSSKSPSSDAQNFQWFLPTGTTPSFV